MQGPGTLDHNRHARAEVVRGELLRPGPQPLGREVAPQALLVEVLERSHERRHALVGK
jgi:hypothetical protein